MHHTKSFSCEPLPAIAGYPIYLPFIAAIFFQFFGPPVLSLSHRSLNPAYLSSCSLLAPSVAALFAAARQSVGLSSLSRQIYKKVAQKGYEFTLMAVGEANTGKTTLLQASAPTATPLLFAKTHGYCGGLSAHDELLRQYPAGSVPAQCGSFLIMFMLIHTCNILTLITTKYIIYFFYRPSLNRKPSWVTVLLSPTTTLAKTHRYCWRVRRRKARQYQLGSSFHLISMLIY